MKEIKGCGHMFKIQKIGQVEFVILLSKMRASRPRSQWFNSFDLRCVRCAINSFDLDIDLK